MRERIIYALAGLGGLLLVYNLYVILVGLPDEAQQGAIYRIIFFHVPAVIVAWIMFSVALGASAAFLVWKNFQFDSLAVAVTEVGVVLLTINLVTGSLWARVIWGIWWTWDARLTSNFISWLLYVCYLIVRPAIAEPTQRATLAAVISIFAFADLPIVYYSNQWWRTQHPSPVLTTGGLDPSMWPPFLTNIVAILFVTTALVLIRLRQENVQRDMDSLRRYAHAI